MPGRMTLAVLGLFLLTVPGVAAAESPSYWLDRAADAGLSRREREFAAQQLLMLADQSASMFISEVENDAPLNGLRRQIAARLLGEIGGLEAAEPLLEATFSSDYFLSQAAAEALVKIYARLSDRDLFQMLRRGQPGTRRSEPSDGDDWLELSLGEAANRERFRALAMGGLAAKRRARPEPIPDDLLQWIWNGLLSPDRELRANSIEAARLSQSDQAAEKLSAFLYTENDARLLTAALRAMADLRPPDYGNAVERHVGHADPGVALEALAALAAMGYENTLFPAIPGSGGRNAAGFVNHPSTPVRRRAAEILAASRDPRAVDWLANAVRDRVGTNRAAAAAALGELGFTAAIGALTPLLGDPHPEARTEAAAALTKLGVVGVAARTLDDLEGGGLPFRRAAAIALGRMGDRRAVGYLTAVLDDEDRELVCLAAEALGALGERSAGPALYRLLTASEDLVVSDAARRALTAIFNMDDPGDTPSGWESWARRNGVG